MDRKARIDDTQLVKSREMRSQTLVVVAGGRRGKDDRKKFYCGQCWNLYE
jgi:hypothetical protein